MYRGGPPPIQVRGGPVSIHLARRLPLAALTAACLTALLVGDYLWLSQGLRAHPPAAQTTTNGASRWVGDTRTTTPTFAAPTPSTQLAVDTLFQKYYTSKGGAGQLGAPLTPAFPIHQGWIKPTQGSGNTYLSLCLHQPSCFCGGNRLSYVAAIPW